MVSNLKEITFEEANVLFVLVGESKDNIDFLNNCAIKNELLVINTDNIEIPDFLKETQILYKQMKYDKLSTKFKSDVIDLMFYGPLRSEFYCIQVATAMQEYLQEYNFITIFSSKLIPISKKSRIELRKCKNTLVESRFKSIPNFMNDDNLTVNALDKMGTVNYSIIRLNPDSRVKQWSELIFSIIKKNGNPPEVFTLGTSLALSLEIITVAVEHIVLTPWNFYEVEDNKRIFLDSSYLNKVGISWATKLPSDITGKEFLEVARILNFDIEEKINSSSYDLNDLPTLHWSNKVKARIIGKYYSDSQNNDASIDSLKFTKWATSPGSRVKSLNRLQEVIYLSRDDIQLAYPIESLNFNGFSGWVVKHGVGELLMEDKYKFITDILKKSINNENSVSTKKLKNGFNVIGYQSYELGLGSAARKYIKILNNLEIETSNFNIKNTVSKAIEFPEYGNSLLPFDKNLVVIGADQIPFLASLSSNDWNRSRYNVGAIFWETDYFPPKISNALFVFDEFIVSSNYIAKNLRNFTDKKVSVVGLPIPHKNDISTKRINNDNIIIYFNFDYLSDIYRKNVYTLIDYVKRKNKDSNNKFKLLIKSINGNHNPLEQAYLSKLISEDDNIHEIGKFLDAYNYEKLLKEVDIYVSLHRSEGFGLGLLEAMNLGITTLATGYSGNLDFMNSDNSYLVDFDLELITNSRRSPYSQFGGSWAQPKFESFSEQIGKFLSQPEERLLRTSRAKNMVNTEFSEKSITLKMEKTLRSSGII
jgi:hypothetical protein